MNQSLFPGNLQNLLIRLLHLPRSLGVDAIAPALFHAEAAVSRELIGPHQCKKIGFLTRFEQLARFGDMFVVATQPHQQIASADQRRAQGRRGHATGFRRFDQHPGVARVHWQPEHLPPDRGEVIPGICDLRFAIDGCVGFSGA